MESGDSPVADEGTTTLVAEINFGPGAISLGIVSRFNEATHPLYAIRIGLSSSVTNVNCIIIDFD
jgi:hypothetical protein